MKMKNKMVMLMMTMMTMMMTRMVTVIMAIMKHNTIEKKIMRINRGRRGE